MNRKTDSIHIQPTIENDELAKLLGGQKKKSLPKSIRKKVRTARQKLNKLIKPSLHYRIVKPSAMDNDVVQLDETVEFTSTQLAKTLKNAEEIVCFVGTIGTGVENEINRLLDKQKLAEAYILDAMASVAVENMIDRFQNLMEKRFSSEERAVTLRFSPGYCDWPVTQQKKLFNIFNPKQLNVELLDSCLMKPRKSVSGVFGITPQESESYNPCRDCPTRRCESRRN
ncbi:MAG: vitamin B12 dependent-methionine synthase activation domain-containing protein [Syntrophobacteria bacterium]